MESLDFVQYTFLCFADNMDVHVTSTLSLGMIKFLAGREMLFQLCHVEEHQGRGEILSCSNLVAAFLKGSKICITSLRFVSLTFCPLPPEMNQCLQTDHDQIINRTSLDIRVCPFCGQLANPLF